MSHQDIYLSVYMLIIMQGWRLLFLISVVFAVMKQLDAKHLCQTSSKLHLPSSYSHDFFICTVLCKVGQHLGHTNLKVSMD